MLESFIHGWAVAGLFNIKADLSPHLSFGQDLRLSFAKIGHRAMNENQF